MSVNLMPTWQIGDVRLTEYPYSVDRDNAVEIGEPAMVVESLASMLADGDIDRVVRHGNRVYVIPCYVEGADLMEVAQAEATLRAELTRSGLVLTHDPGDGFAPASAYDVLTAQMTPERNDTHESHLIRKWTLTLTCEPFAHSVDPVTVEALSADGAPTTTTIDTCDSTTGWEVSGGPTLSVVSGAVSVLTPDPAFATVQPRREATVDFTTTPYLIVEWRFATTGGETLSNSGNTLRVRDDAGAFPPVQNVALADGWRRTTFLADGSSSFLMFTADIAGVYTGSLWRFEIRDLKRSNVSSDSPRQITRVVDTGGTERTPASIHVEAPDGTSSLLTSIVHTCPEDGSGYSPPLRRWRISGNTPTPDTAALSGAWEPLTPNPFTADLPIGAVPTDGYVIAARVRSTITQTCELSWSVTTVVPDYPGLPGPLPSDSGEQTFTLFEDAATFVALGMTTLPTLRTTASDASVRIIIGHPAVDGTVSIDEGWIFRVGEDSALTVVEGVFRPLLRLESPTVDTPVPTVLFGTADAAIHPGPLLRATGNHVLTPEGTAVFTATEGVEYPATSATFHRRWHSNAAE